jgi:hypothetical protein
MGAFPRLCWDDFNGHLAGGMYYVDFTTWNWATNSAGTLTKMGCVDAIRNGSEIFTDLTVTFQQLTENPQRLRNKPIPVAY